MNKNLIKEKYIVCIPQAASKTIAYFYLITFPPQHITPDSEPSPKIQTKRHIQLTDDWQDRDDQHLRVLNDLSVLSKASSSALCQVFFHYPTYQVP